MSTTTIRLPEDLRARVKELAERSGTTAHNFILEAIAEKAELEERRADFHETANHRYARLLKSGQTVPWTEMRHYLTESAAGRKPARPAPRKLPR